MAVSRRIRRSCGPGVQCGARGGRVPWGAAARPAVARRATAALLAVCAAVALSGCSSEPARITETPGLSLSIEEYVAHMAALTVAVEEGLSGDDAAARSIELGSGGHAREEVEQFTDAMRLRPEDWADVEARVNKRVREIRRTESRD